MTDRIAPDPSLDDDPTGMRALLSGLPDPGPMPEHVVHRIHASLAALAAEHADPPVPVAPGRAAPSDEVPFAGPHGLGDLNAARGRRATPRWLPWAAAAGLVAVAGGGLALGAGGQSVTAAFQGSSADSVAAGARANAAAEDAKAATAAFATVIVMSNQGWTDAGLTAAASSLLDSTAASMAPLASESPSIGPIGTPLGARDCASALGVAPDARVIVDLGTYAGRPAALVVASTSDGQHTAYLVGRQCRQGSPELVAGPFSL